VLIRELVKNRHQSPIYINGVTMLWAGSAALLSSFMLEDWSPVPVFTSWLHFSLLSGAIIVIAQIIFQNFYAYLLRYYTATLLSFAGFTCPFFSALFGWLFLGESISVYFFFSMLLVIVGLVLFYQEELRLGYIKSYKNDKNL
jgi:drug/metabolite transporter (DMT)-like permease